MIIIKPDTRKARMNIYILILWRKIRILKPMKRQTAVFAILVMIFLPSLSLAADTGRNCIDWPRTMAKQELTEMPGGPSIHIGTFENFTKQPGDEWLCAAIRDYLTDLLRSGEGVRVLSGLTAAYGASAGGPDYSIGGIFQHADGKLRVFVKLMEENSAKLLRQYEILFPYPDNQDFFKKIAEAAEDILKQIKAPCNGKVLSAVRDATASTRAYESYSKGRQSLRAYDIKGTEQAKRWFDDTKRIDYRSPLGYEGLIDFYTFLGFYHRQQQEPYASYFQMAEAEMTRMLKLAKPAPLLMTRKKNKIVKKPKPEAPKLDNPLILNNIAYSEGLKAMQMGYLDAAANAFRRATEIVPEDALSWYYLSQVEAGRGDIAASQAALRKAYEFNPCVR